MGLQPPTDWQEALRASRTANHQPGMRRRIKSGAGAVRPSLAVRTWRLTWTTVTVGVYAAVALLVIDGVHTLLVWATLRMV